MLRKTRSEIMDDFKAQVAQGKILVGVGAGTGITAKCSEKADVDMLIIYNSGRFRMAGRGSLSGLLSYGDANAIVQDKYVTISINKKSVEDARMIFCQNFLSIRQKDIFLTIYSAHRGRVCPAQGPKVAGRCLCRRHPGTVGAGLGQLCQRVRHRKGHLPQQRQG